MADLETRVRKLEAALSEFSAELRLALRYVQPDAASSLTKSRLVLEKLLLRIYQVEMGQEPRKPLLGDMLNDNQFTRKLERRIVSRMNSIRDMGNLGPHGEPVEPSDAARVLDDLCEVLDWYLGRTSNAQSGLDPNLSEAAHPVDEPASSVRPVSVEMPCVRFKVMRSNGEMHEIEAPQGMLVRELVDELLTALNISRRLDGRLIPYKMVFRATGKYLDGDRSLQENGLTEGSEVVLAGNIVAAG